jgi:hypothetical protein
MRRRELLLLVGGAVAARPGAGRTEEQRRVGYLSLRSADTSSFLADYRRGLDETGYTEGRNLVIEYRYADGDFSRLPPSPPGSFATKSRSLRRWVRQIRLEPR